MRGPVLEAEALYLNNGSQQSGHGSGDCVPRTGRETIGVDIFVFAVFANIVGSGLRQTSGLVFHMSPFMSGVSKCLTACRCSGYYADFLIKQMFLSVC